MVSAYRRAVNASTAQQVEAKVDTDTGKVTIFAERKSWRMSRRKRPKVTLDGSAQGQSRGATRRHGNCRINPADLAVWPHRLPDRSSSNASVKRNVRRRWNTSHDKRARSYQDHTGYKHARRHDWPDMKAEGILPAKSKIPNERFKVHDRIRARCARSQSGSRGPQIILSRAHRNFLRRLLEMKSLRSITALWRSAPCP